MQPRRYTGLMQRTSFADMNCSVAQALEVVGEWWTLLILRDAVLGVRRFEEFQGRLGIARNVLADRLQKLVDHGVLERRPYQDRPRRDEYVLTAKGRDLLPVIHALREWGDRWVFGRDRAPVRIVHDGCGRRTRAVTTCEHCGERLDPGDTRAVPGPGATGSAPPPR